MELLTASRMNTLLSCPRRHYWRYEVGLEALDDAAALRFGTAWHNAMEAHAKGVTVENAFMAALGDGQQIDELQAATLYGLLSGYYGLHPFGDCDFEELLPEVEFRVQLGNSRTFEAAGKIDGLGRLRDKRLAMMEHKTTSDSLDSGSDYWERLRWNMQILQYVDAARVSGWDVEAVIYSVTRKPSIRPRDIPELDADGLKIVVDAAGQRVMLANGKLRQSAGDGMTLKSRPETPEEFGDRLKADALERPDFYFARREVPILEDDLAEFREQRRMLGFSIIAYRAAQKRMRRPEQAWPRNCSQVVCAGCPFARFCLQNISVDLATPPAGFRLGVANPELNAA